MSVRLPTAVALAALATALAPLSACATGNGAGAGEGEGGGARARRAQVLDLMAKKPDSEPMGDQPTPGKVKGRRLDRAVSRTVETNRPAFQSCVEKTSKQKGRVHTRATLLLTIRPDGVVSDARVAERRLHGRKLGQCLVAASYRMSFPPFDGSPMQVKVPLRLTAE